MFQQIVIQVPDEVSEAFLLGTIDCIIHRIEIRHKNPLEVLEHRLYGATFLGWRIKICNLLHASKSPDITIRPPNADACLVYM